MHLNLANADAIIIDEEDDTPTTNDDPHDPIVVGNSSPDPVDFLAQKHSYAFDQKKAYTDGSVQCFLGRGTQVPTRWRKYTARAHNSDEAGCIAQVGVGFSSGQRWRRYPARETFFFPEEVSQLCEQRYHPGRAT